MLGRREQSSSPRKISELTVPGTVMEIFLDGSMAYLSCLGAGIQMVISQY
jgi:hypothetical protein